MCVSVLGQHCWRLTGQWTLFNWPEEKYREGDGTPLQYSGLEYPMDGGAWWAAVHGVTKSQTWLNNFTFTFHFHALEKEMATHSSTYSCLENPRDRGAWWAAIYGVAQSQTRLKQRSSRNKEKLSAYESNNSKFKKIKTEFQADVNWEIFTIELMPGIDVCLLI